MPEFDATLARARYVSVATTRRDGREVLTPVWIVARGAGLYCYSAKNAGKVKRVRNTGRARLATCDARGKQRGDWHSADARVLDDPQQCAAVYRALREKYGWQMWLADVAARLAGRYHKRDVLEFLPTAT